MISDHIAASTLGDPWWDCEAMSTMLSSGRRRSGAEEDKDSYSGGRRGRGRMVEYRFEEDDDYYYYYDNDARLGQ